MDFIEYLTPVYWQLEEANKRNDKELSLYFRGFLMGALSVLGASEQITPKEQLSMMANINSPADNKR